MKCNQSVERSPLCILCIFFLSLYFNIWMQCTVLQMESSLEVKSISPKKFEKFLCLCMEKILVWHKSQEIPAVAKTESIKLNQKAAKAERSGVVFMAALFFSGVAEKLVKTVLVMLESTRAFQLVFGQYSCLFPCFSVSLGWF